MRIFPTAALGTTALILAAALPAAAADRSSVVETYADIAQAMYEDSLIAAHDLRAAVAALVEAPSAATLARARGAWLAARVPYQQSEVYRFGNPLVDEWEGKVNAWPLDEGLIDYVDLGAYGFESDENLLFTANVIASDSITFGGQTIDVSAITPDLLAGTLHEADNIEANVATGYHAVEFLLWGQDLNGTGPGAGDRPATDFDIAGCTGGACDRRIDYLIAATDLLITDLEEIVALWAPGGGARAAVTADADAGLAAIVTGLGSLSYGELAGERMQLGLLLHDPEEEHDCFADNTHNSHYYNQVGMRAIYTATYQRLDGSVVTGPSFADAVADADPALDTAIRAHLAQTLSAMDVMVAAAEGGMAYDQMLGEDNPVGNAILQDVIDTLIVQAGSFEAAVAALGLRVDGFEGSDSLDDPASVL